MKYMYLLSLYYATHLSVKYLYYPANFSLTSYYPAHMSVTHFYNKAHLSVTSLLLAHLSVINHFSNPYTYSPKLSPCIHLFKVF